MNEFIVINRWMERTGLAILVQSQEAKEDEKEQLLLHFIFPIGQ